MRRDWLERLDAEREQFVDSLISRGFRLASTSTERRLTGDLNHSHSHPPVAIEITLPSGWPYQPTKIRPVGPVGTSSWHQESDGTLCLFPEGTPGLPWADPDQLLARASEWFDQAAAGWPDDEPDLDLGRYFHHAARDELLLYDDVGTLLGQHITVERADNRTLVVHASEKWRAVSVWSRSRRAQAVKGTQYGWALDLGELAAPVRTWEEICSHLGDKACRADRLVREAKSAVLLVRYQRGSNEGVVALQARVSAGDVHLEHIESACRGVDTLRLRAGYDAKELSRFTVCIVGVGAIGSFLADHLSRGGIRKLRLVDGQRLRPGNSIRHLTGRGAVGERKAVAVAAHIRRLGHAPSGGIETVIIPVAEPAHALKAFEGTDLVVDATGNPTTTSLLVNASESLQQSLVVTYLQRDGDLARLERYPVAEGEESGLTVPPGPSEREILRESGCGDPVSPSPPSAASVSAGLAAQVAADVLVGRPVPATLTYVLRPQPDAPFRQHAVLR